MRRVHLGCCTGVKRGSLFSINFSLATGAGKMFSGVKLGILLFSNAWHLPVSESGVILVTGFYGHLGRCYLLF